jgi:hypothetical protein
MCRGLSKVSRYLPAGASAIGILAAGAGGVEAQDLKEIQAQIDAMQTTIKALPHRSGGFLSRAPSVSALHAGSGGCATVHLQKTVCRLSVTSTSLPTK